MLEEKKLIEEVTQIIELQTSDNLLTNNYINPIANFDNGKLDIQSQSNEIQKSDMIDLKNDGIIDNIKLDNQNNMNFSAIVLDTTLEEQDNEINMNSVQNKPNVQPNMNRVHEMNYYDQENVNDLENFDKFLEEGIARVKAHKVDNNKFQKTANNPQTQSQLQPHVFQKQKTVLGDFGNFMDKKFTNRKKKLVKESNTKTASNSQQQQIDKERERLNQQQSKLTSKQIRSKQKLAKAETIDSIFPNTNISELISLGDESNEYINQENLNISKEEEKVVEVIVEKMNKALLENTSPDKINKMEEQHEEVQKIEEDIDIDIEEASSNNEQKKFEESAANRFTKQQNLDKILKDKKVKDKKNKINDFKWISMDPSKKREFNYQKEFEKTCGNKKLNKRKLGIMGESKPDGASANLKKRAPPAEGQIPTGCQNASGKRFLDVIDNMHHRLMKFGRLDDDTNTIKKKQHNNFDFYEQDDFIDDPGDYGHEMEQFESKIDDYFIIRGGLNVIFS